MTTEAAWNYAIGMIKVDGLEPTEDFKNILNWKKTGKLRPRTSKNIWTKNINILFNPADKTASPDNSEGILHQ